MSSLPFLNMVNHLIPPTLKIHNLEINSSPRDNAKWKIIFLSNSVSLAYKSRTACKRRFIARFYIYSKILHLYQDSTFIARFYKKRAFWGFFQAQEGDHGNLSNYYSSSLLEKSLNQRLRWKELQMLVLIFQYFTNQEMTLQGNSFQPFFWTKNPRFGRAWTWT